MEPTVSQNGTSRDVESLEPQNVDGVSNSRDDSQTEEAAKPNGQGAATSSRKKPRFVGGHALWKRGPVDHIRVYLLSDGFQACVQLALSKPPPPALKHLGTETDQSTT